MYFIKKNMIMLIVLSIGTLISAFLVYQVIVETDKMNTAVDKVGDLKEKLKELNKTSPIPNKENLKRIENDTAVIKEKVKDFQHIFGHPYFKAITAMAGELALTLDELRKKWKTIYTQEHEKGMAREFIFTKFSGEFDNQKWIKAVALFTKEVNKKSQELLNAANADGCIMEALGLPRKMEPIPCKNFILDAVMNLNKYMRDTGDPDKIFIFGSGKEGDDVESLTFKKFNGDSLPRPDEIPYIFKQLELIQDLLYRIKSSKIDRLDEISRETMKGTLTGDYLVFNYTLKVTGSLKSIRAFINNLLLAYKDNRIYIVRKMTLTTEDEAEKVLQSTSTTSRTITARRGTRRRRGELPDANEEESNEPEQVEINVPIIGTSNSVTAEITFDYVIYVGDEIGV